MRSSVFLTSALVLILALSGCGSLEPSSEEVADVAKRVSGGMEGLRPDFWEPTDIPVVLDDPVASGDVLRVRLSDLQMQKQQPPGEPALRLVAQMHLLNQLAEDDRIMLVSYRASFLTSEGEVLATTQDVQPLLEELSPGEELTVEFRAPVPALGDDVQQIRPEPNIGGMAIEIAYEVGDASKEDTVTFSLTFGTE